ncbi:hypothetical protein [Sphaerimonospora mesophila]|uniref:hypothetical protein n=1 Tax=Sphaerimonospora mesophila TaxID=37483 RepID=UPI0006E2A858
MVSSLRVPAALAASAVLFYFGTGLTPIAALTWIAPLPLVLLAPWVGPWTAFGAAFPAGLLGETS